MHLSAITTLTTAALVAALMAGAPAEARYQVLADGPEARAAITAVEATSVRDGFAIGQVKDDNLSSAWAPVPLDLAPSLTLTLGTRARVGAIAIKLDPAGTLVDVAVDNGTDWRPIASGLAPSAGNLVRLDLPDTDASRLRLSFRNASAEALRVCEVQVFTVGAATSPLPTTAPSGTGLRVSGGGWVPVPGTIGSPHPGKGKGHEKGHGKGHEKGHGKGHQKDQAQQARVSFSLSAQANPPSGQLKVVDMRSHTTYRGRVTSFSRDGATATLGGVLESGGTFTAVVSDRGRSDSFAFRASDGYTVEGTLGGGDIRLQP